MHFHGRTERASRHLGEGILGTRTSVTGGIHGAYELTEAVTVLFSPADGTEAIQSRMVLVVY